MMSRGDYFEFEGIGCDHENGQRLTASLYSLNKSPTKEDIKEWIDELKRSEGSSRGKKFAQQMELLKLKEIPGMSDVSR
jgi:hypothetical protein